MEIVLKGRLTGIRPFQCNYCDVRFAHLPYLKMHMRDYHGFKPVRCERRPVNIEKRKEIIDHCEKNELIPQLNRDATSTRETSVQLETQTRNETVYQKQVANILPLLNFRK